MIWLLLVGDFGQYWVHRIQHAHLITEELSKSTSPARLHIDNIDGIDAFLQSALLVPVSSIVVRPHPVPYYECIVLRESENAVEHSGLQLARKLMSQGCDHPVNTTSRLMMEIKFGKGRMDKVKIHYGDNHHH